MFPQTAAEDSYLMGCDTELVGGYFTGSAESYCLQLQGQEVQGEKPQKKECYVGMDDTGSKLHMSVQAD